MQSNEKIGPRDPERSEARRLIAAIVGTLVGFVVLTGLTQYRETANAHHTALVIDNAMPSVQYISAARSELQKLRTCVTRHTRYHECDLETIAADRQELGATLDHYYVLPPFPTEAERQVKTRELVAAFDAKTSYLETMAARGIDDATAITLVRELGNDAVALDGSLADLVEFNAREARVQAAVFDASRHASMHWTVAVNAICMGLVLWAVTLIMRALKRSALLRDEIARAHESNFRLLVDSVRDYAIFLLDAGGRVTSWNAGAEVIEGYRADEVIGRHFSALYPPDEREARAHELTVACDVGSVRSEGWRVRKDGTRFWGEAISTALRKADGTLKGFIKVTRDLTVNKRAEEERLQADAAKASSRAKDEFLATLGHELRNPLAPIMMAVELMKLRGDQGSSRELEIIERQVQHVTGLVDDLLDVSRIASNKIQLKKSALDLRVVATRAVEIAMPVIERRRHEIEISIPEGTRLCADEGRLSQIFANLLTNAAKYTEPGGHISLRASREGRDVVIEVKDDGIGISPELLPHVFELFVQGPERVARSGGGLGIGLSIVRTLVAMHGGTVSVISGGSGRGSTFAVRLPALVDGPSTEARPLLSAPLSGVTAKRILLVDDNEDALVMLAEVLRTIGHDVRAATDGASALEMIKEFRPDVAILDIGLPGMSGYELASRMRSELGPATPRLIALTGYGQEDDRAKSTAGGFEAHLVKPIDTVRLLETIH